MPNVILIIGLPASGKTTLAYQLQKENGYQIIDDPKNISEFAEILKSRQNVIVTDPHLCNPLIRQKAIEFWENNKYGVKLIFFEKDIKKCQNNLIHRNDNRIIKHFEVFDYIIPKDVETIKIWQNNSQINK